MIFSFQFSSFRMYINRISGYFPFFARAAPTCWHTLLFIFQQIIYVSRNPKDVLVSFYHFHKMANFLPDAGSFPEFLHHFLEGTCELTFFCFCNIFIVFPKFGSFPPGSVHFGSWFDHIKGWTSQAAALNLLHVTYEEMSTVKNCSFILK